MIARIGQAAICAVLALSATVVHASSTNYADENNTLDVGEQYVIFEQVTGMFEDTHTFVLGNSADAEISAITLDLGTDAVFAFANISASLEGPSDESYEIPVDGSTQFLQLTPSATYSLVINGGTSGSAGGIYTAAVAAVPEPEQWALLLAGLALVGWSQRKQLHKSMTT